MCIIKAEIHNSYRSGELFSFFKEFFHKVRLVSFYYAATVLTMLENFEEKLQNRFDLRKEHDKLELL